MREARSGYRMDCNIRIDSAEDRMVTRDLESDKELPGQSAMRESVREICLVSAFKN